MIKRKRLSSASVEPTDIGYARLPDDLPAEQWYELLLENARTASAARWRMADLLAHGETADYGKTYDAAIRATGLSYSRLTTLKSAAKAFNFCRRRQNLKIDHHIETLPLPADEQDALLDLAESAGWKRDELRQAVKDKLRAHGMPGYAYGQRVNGVEIRPKFDVRQPDLSVVRRLPDDVHELDPKLIRAMRMSRAAPQQLAEPAGVITPVDEPPVDEPAPPRSITSDIIERAEPSPVRSITSDIIERAEPVRLRPHARHAQFTVTLSGTPAEMTHDLRRQLVDALGPELTRSICLGVVTSVRRFNFLGG
jgi:hypothetical protein